MKYLEAKENITNIQVRYNVLVVVSVVVSGRQLPRLQEKIYNMYTNDS